MEADHNFNVRTARIVKCTPIISTGASTRHGVSVTLYANGGTLKIYMTPEEAKTLGSSLQLTAADAETYIRSGNVRA